MASGIPIYVTREDASGIVGSWQVRPAPAVVIIVLALLNAILWGIYGAVRAMTLLFGLV